MASLPRIENNADVRFLGAKLGEVIRSYGGDELSEATEAIRKASVDRARAQANGQDGFRNRAAPDLRLGKLALAKTPALVRGLLLFHRVVHRLHRAIHLSH